MPALLPHPRHAANGEGEWARAESKAPGVGDDRLDEERQNELHLRERRERDMNVAQVLARVYEGDQSLRTSHDIEELAKAAELRVGADAAALIRSLGADELEQHLPREKEPQS